MAAAVKRSIPVAKCRVNEEPVDGSTLCRSVLSCVQVGQRRNAGASGRAETLYCSRGSERGSRRSRSMIIPGAINKPQHVKTKLCREKTDEGILMREEQRSSHPFCLRVSLQMSGLDEEPDIELRLRILRVRLVVYDVETF